jgi:predicted nucleic acid-binding Zn ribbon protein
VGDDDFLSDECRMARERERERERERGVTTFRIIVATKMKMEEKRIKL